MPKTSTRPPMFRSFRPIVIGIGVAIALLMVNPATSPVNALNTKVCSSATGFKYYDRAGIAESVRNSQIMAIGTVKDVEVRVVDWYQPASIIPQQNASGDNDNHSEKGTVQLQNMGQKIPWKFVTFDVEKYLFDKNGEHKTQITFRAPANQCVDKFGMLSPEQNARPDASPEFHKGEKVLVEINGVQGLGELYFDNGYKFDIIDDKTVQSNPKMGLETPIRTETLVAEIAEEARNQGVD
jgi:hypothetical protein